MDAEGWPTAGHHRVSWERGLGAHRERALSHLLHPFARREIMGKHWRRSTHAQSPYEQEGTVAATISTNQVSSLTNINNQVRHEVGGCAPQAARIGELQQCHEVNQEKARKLGMNVGNFTATAPVHTHIAREPDAVARVRKLAETGNITTGSLWHTVGAVAVNSWQVFAAQDAINAKAMKESATDAAAKAAADLVVLTEAENLANSSTLSDPNNMSDAQLNTAVKFIFVAKPEQPVVRSSIKGKAGKVAFLSGLTPAWHCLLAEARLACTAAVTAASTAMDEAEAAEAAVFINNQPPAPPSVVPGAVTADAVDVQNMSEAERRALLARLVDAGP